MMENSSLRVPKFDSRDKSFLKETQVLFNSAKANYRCAEIFDARRKQRLNQTVKA